MTAGAALADGVMLENERAALRGVTLRAGLVRAEQEHSSAFHLLRQIRFRTFEGHPLVRVMAVDAAHLAFHHRVAMRQLEFGADFEVALKAGLRIPLRVYD